MEHLFRGSALSSIDAKGRLSVPAFIRQKIERRSDEKLLVLAKHKLLPCLVGYDANYSPEHDPTYSLPGAAPRELSAEDVEREELSRAMAELDTLSGLYGNPADIPYDPSGRIVMPGRLKKRAGIEDFAMFVGMREVFMVWNPRTAITSGARQLAELAADLLEEKGLAA